MALATFRSSGGEIWGEMSGNRLVLGDGGISRRARLIGSRAPTADTAAHDGKALPCAGREQCNVWNAPEFTGAG